jgi:tRNA threonylcarbamoyladenosine biosynthesis protein TsaE
MPILDARALEFFSRSPEQTRRLGMRLGTMLCTGDVLCLSGELGSGKTTFVQGLAQGWGSLDGVTSPTFVLVNLYRKPGGESLYHLDAYRLQNAAEAEDLDITLMLENGPLVIEWPERIEAVVPKERLLVKMSWVADEQRALVFLPEGSRYEQMLAEFRRRAIGG